MIKLSLKEANDPIGFILESNLVLKLLWLFLLKYYHLRAANCREESLSYFIREVFGLFLLKLEIFLYNPKIIF